MLTYLVNTKTGKHFESDLSLQDRKKYLSTHYRMMTVEERIAYIRAALRAEAKYIKDKGLMDVHYISTSGNHDGYGMSGAMMRKEMIRYGIYLNPRFNNQEVAFVYHIPSLGVEQIMSPKSLLYTMFESDKLPPEFITPLTEPTVVATPAKEVTAIFKQYRQDVETIPLGYNQKTFKYIQRDWTKKEEFVMLHYDAFKHRKGWDILLNAYDQEFTAKDKVRLIFKTTLTNTPYLGEYRNIEVIRGKLPQSELMTLLARAHLFVYPTRGEGFGLTPLEAMATGLPAIVPNVMGCAEYWDYKSNASLETQKVRARYDRYEWKDIDLGTQQEPTVDSLRRVMRAMYEAWMTGDELFTESRSQYIAQYARKYTITKTCKAIAQKLHLLYDGRV